jgi:hypothetical protein
MLSIILTLITVPPVCWFILSIIDPPPSKPKLSYPCGDEWMKKSRLAWPNKIPPP